MNARFVGRADFVCRTALIGILLIILAFALSCGTHKADRDSVARLASGG